MNTPIPVYTECQISCPDGMKRNGWELSYGKFINARALTKVELEEYLTRMTTPQSGSPFASRRRTTVLKGSNNVEEDELEL